jgi:hypothetical protein
MKVGIFTQFFITVKAKSFVDSETILHYFLHTEPMLGMSVCLHNVRVNENLFFTSQVTTVQ